MFILVILTLASLACAATENLPELPSPTPVASYTPAPTLDPNDFGEAYDQLSTAAANMNSLPDNVSAPGGVPLVPDANGAEMFAYMKSIMSGNQQRELTGDTLFPLVTSATIFITMIVVVSGIRFVVNIVSQIIKIAVAIYRLLIRLFKMLIGAGGGA